MPADTRLLDDDQKALVGLVREFAVGELAPAVEDYERRSEDPLPLYGKLAELGLTGLPFPEEYGGGGQPYSTYLMCIEELARAYLGFAIGVSVHTLCAFAVNEFGTDVQKKEVLEKLTTGEWFGAYSLSEPASVTLTVRKGEKTLRTLRLQVRSGAHKVKVRRLGKGRRTFALQARDAAGNRSETVSASIRVRRK